MKQANFCVECGCKCKCNGDCAGDTKKGTSKKALKKGCNHHCECYVGPMVESWEEKGLIETGRKK